jgi:hypothetical protein
MILVGDEECEPFDRSDAQVLAAAVDQVNRGLNRPEASQDVAVVPRTRPITSSSDGAPIGKCPIIAIFYPTPFSHGFSQKIRWVTKFFLLFFNGN